ncbi:hypothetical protein Peur_058627 [Populus x canadensis]
MAKNKRKVTVTTTRGKAILHSSIPVDHDHDQSTVLALQAPSALDFSFTDDDGEDLLTSTPLLSPPAGLVPPATSEGRPPSAVDVGGCASPSNTISCAISPEDFQPQFEPGYKALNGIISFVWNEEMSRVPVWVRFPNLPICCWSPSCLSKIASVLGKPIQSDHMTFTLSRMSYARVLVEIDLREDLQHSVAKAVYEALPKFCNYCNVLGHTRLLWPKEKTRPPLALGPSADPTKTVIMDNKLALCVAFEGWITMEPRQKSSKHIRGTPKGKEVIAVETGSDVNPCSELPPSVCANVVGSLGTGALVGANVDSVTTSCLAPSNLG